MAQTLLRHAQGFLSCYKTGLTSGKESMEPVWGGMPPGSSKIVSTAVGSSGENGTRKRVSPFAVGIGHTSTGKTEPSIAKCKCRSAGITLHAAVDYPIKRMNLAESSKTLREVADFVIAYKHSNGSSPRHLKGMRSIFSKVCEDLGERAKTSSYWSGHPCHISPPKSADLLRRERII